MEFKEYALDLEFELNENIYFKQKKDYFLYLKNWKYLTLNIPSIYIPVMGKINKEIIKKIEQAALNNACSFEKLNDKCGMIIVSLPDGNKKDNKFVETYKNIESRVIKLLEIENINPLNVCPICFEEATRHSFLGNYVPIHEECYKGYFTQLEDEVNNAKDNDFLFLISSIIFSCVGLVPVILCTYFLHGYIAPVILFSPLGIALSVILFKFPKRKWIKICACLIPFILIAIFNIFSIPFLAKCKEMNLQDFFFTEGFEGLRKVILTTIISFSPFGILKMITNLVPNKKELLNSLKEDELFKKL